MAHVLITTLGQRPEAITMAFDQLDLQYNYTEVVVLHTEPTHSGIAKSLSTLREVFETDYEGLAVSWREIYRANGAGLLDVQDEVSAQDYHNGVLSALHEYKVRGDWVHLLVSGGRKAMSIYATLAASVVFTKWDRVWTILSHPQIVSQRGVFHVPEGWESQVNIVRLPILTLRTPANDPHFPQDPTIMLTHRQNIREDFLRRLTKAERTLVELLTHRPRATTPELATELMKSHKTIEHQFTSIYKKMIGFLDYGFEDVDATKRRHILLDILLDR